MIFLNRKYAPASRLQEIAEAVEGWARSWAVNQLPAGREPLPSTWLTACLLLMAGENCFIWAASSSLHFFFSVPAEDPSTF